MTTRRNVIDCARTWLGTPWAHQACLKGQGVDCAQLVAQVGREVGLFAEEFKERSYSRRPDGSSLMRLCREHMQEVALDQIVLGNVGVFRITRYPQHLAFFGDYLHGGTSIIHALENRGGTGKVVETVLDTPMLKRLVAVFELRGIQ